LIKSIAHEEIEQIYSMIIQLEQAKEMSYFETALLYVLHVTDAFSVDLLKERLSMEGRQTLMTIAEKLRQEGKREGLQEGRKEVARKMLLMNKDEREIIELTGLTKEEVDGLKESSRE